MILHADLDGERLDAFLARAVENLSRSGAQKLLEEGCVKRNGKPSRYGLGRGYSSINRPRAGYLHRYATDVSPF